MKVPGNCQDELTQTLIVCLSEIHLFSLVQYFLWGDVSPWPGGKLNLWSYIPHIYRRRSRDLSTGHSLNYYEWQPTPCTGSTRHEGPIRFCDRGHQGPFHFRGKAPKPQTLQPGGRPRCWRTPGGGGTSGGTHPGRDSQPTPAVGQLG